MRKNAFQAARRDSVGALFTGLGSLILVMLPFTTEIARAFQATQVVVFSTILALGLVGCLAGLLRWRSRYAWAIPGLLLQINRCGCCGAGFPKRGSSWTANSCCPECGLAWSPLARLGPLDNALEREAA